jgi:2Fe-2S ferredoxin
VADPSTQTINITVRLPEDAVLETTAVVGETLLAALEAADLSDVWEGGACAGACNCSTCRCIISDPPAPLPPKSEEEEDMLDTAATAAARLGGEAEAYLAESSRLACQLVIQREHDGLVLELPDDVTNVLEVPLWLRGSR